MAHQEDINKWVELHKDQIQSTAEALVVEDILAEKIAEMREQERKNALNIDPREDVRLNYFKGLKIKPHSQEILYPTKILKLKTKNIKKEIQHNYGDSDLVWFSNKINGPDFDDKNKKWLHDLSESNPVNTKDYKPLPVGQEPIRNDVIVKVDNIYDEQLASGDLLYFNQLDTSSYRKLSKAVPPKKYKWNQKIDEESNNIPKKNNFFNELVLKLSKVRYAPITAQGVGTDEVEVDSNDTGINLGETDNTDVTNLAYAVIAGAIIVIGLYNISKN